MLVSSMSHDILTKYHRSVLRSHRFIERYLERHNNLIDRLTMKIEWLSFKLHDIEQEIVRIRRLRVRQRILNNSLKRFVRDEGLD